jgi:hypothetical protein
MQRWTAFVLAVLVLASVGALVLGGREPSGGSREHATGVDAGSAVGDAGATPEGDAGAAAELADEADADVVDPGSPFEPSAVSDAGMTLPNGEAAPSTLPEAAPKSVVFGAILVTYRGAQGAPAKARAKDAAEQLARGLAADAKTDFAAALAKGDKGSIANAGRMPRGVLEPAPEFVLFTLPKDGVSDPVDTPRGFLIFKRID